MRLIELEEIQETLDLEKAYAMQKEGFRAFAAGKLIQPPVAHLNLPEGSLHIKFGMIQGDSHFVVKQATGFSKNWKQGLRTGDGFLSVFCAQTGRLTALILDQSYLTDLRTAFAVRIAVEKWAPPTVSSVGVLGTGTQARLAVQQQALATGCRNILVWGRHPERLRTYKDEMERDGFHVIPVETPIELLEQSDIVLTTCSSREPLLPFSENLRAQLIVAVGADEAGKQELDTRLSNSAKRVIADSPEQCLQIGELQHAHFRVEEIVPLGAALDEPVTPVSGLTLVDLTGLAVQDIQMVNAIIFGKHRLKN